MKRNWLIQIRKSRNMTQKDVAALAFIDRAFYSQIENSKRNPSMTVANNIARVLEFNPLQFYKDNIENNSDTISQPTDQFRDLRNGNILYVYNDPKKYLQKCVKFLMTGMEIKSHCVIIDTHENNLQVQKNVNEFYVDNDKLSTDFIHFINKEELTVQKDSLNIIQKLQNHVDHCGFIRIWIHNEEEQLNKVETLLDTMLFPSDKMPIVFVQSFNASNLSAELYIELMRIYPYLMTDSEMVDSPLCKTNSNSTILPSLFSQEDL